MNGTDDVAGVAGEAVLALVDLAELDSDPEPELVRTHGAALQVVASWMSSYLARPHRDLGRPGPVCLFVPGALESGAVQFGVVRGSPRADVIDRTMHRYRSAFLHTAAANHRGRQHSTILVLFPDVTTEDAPGVIDAAQLRLKPSFVEAGLMIGQFHPGPPAAQGLWNPDFRPFAAPLPLLAIRHMHARDFPFLRHHAEFVREYLRRFNRQIPDDLRADVQRAAESFALQIDDQEQR